MAEQKYYVVWSGRRPGVYDTWEECRKQVIGQKGVRYKSFKGISREEALEIWEKGPQTPLVRESPTQIQPPQELHPLAMAVDAACSGNPGEMEYRGVDIASGTTLFQSQKYPKGTNNIGEFLAIVHALALMERQGMIVPLYTDSKTALAWVRNKKVKTNLPREPKTETLWQHIDRALSWLMTHDLSRYSIYKWDTSIHGEIPADYGRKK